MFDPLVTEAFLEVLSSNEFILDLKTSNTGGFLKSLESHPSLMIEVDSLKKIAEVFATIIDSKSRFTYLHSQEVANLTVKLSEAFNLDDNTVKMMECAALLHDLGKLAVPKEILDKPEKLTPEEFEVIKTHPYYTKRILSEVKGLLKISKWAANHHEKLDGSGYPQGLNSKKLKLQDRIIAVADIYCALTEERPYRKPMSKEEALRIMFEEAKRSKLDAKVLKTLTEVI